LEFLDQVVATRSDLCLVLGERILPHLAVDYRFHDGSEVLVVGVAVDLFAVAGLDQESA
jgi:hypothetical protein